MSICRRYAILLLSIVFLSGCQSPAKATRTDGATPLIMAAWAGHVQDVRRLLVAKADVNAARTTDGVTPLIVASQEGHTEVVQLLLAAKADVNAASVDGRTPLWVASSKGYAEIVQLLLAAKATVNAVITAQGATPLWIASQEGHSRVVSLLLAAKADVNAADTGGRTPLLQASQNGHTEVIQLLLAAEADVNGKNNDGKTPLLVAIQSGHVDLARQLLAKGADGNGALLTATEEGDFVAVPDLLSLGVDASGTGGAMALVKSALAMVHKSMSMSGFSGDVRFTGVSDGQAEAIAEVVEELVAGGADPDARDEDGRTALEIMAADGHDNVGDRLIPRTARAKEAYVRVMSALIGAGADVNTRNEMGATPLHRAAYNGDIAAVSELLMAEEIEINAITKTGLTPLRVATLSGHQRVGDILRQHGGKTNRPAED